ncbi:MAG: DUF3786 domain-containing protein [Clostridiales bacterium]|nr:DUF3786 domain-containing protein [Clostridiales bacterium]
MNVNNYSIQAEAARAGFVKWDQDAMISRLGLEADDSHMYIEFFQERHSIDRLNGKVFRCAAGTPAGFNATMSIYDVLCCSKAEAFLSGEWQTLENLSPHSNFGSSGKNLFGSAAKRLSGDIEGLRGACTILGGREATKADAGFAFDVFPFLPTVFQYWDGDDEFEPRIKFLFDANTLDYIHFETAWYIAEHLIGLIEKEELRHK